MKVTEVTYRYSMMENGIESSQSNFTLVGQQLNVLLAGEPRAISVP